MYFLTLMHSVRFYFHIVQEKAQVLGFNMSSKKSMIHTTIRSNYSREYKFLSPSTPKPEISTLRIRFFPSLHSSLALSSINLHRIIVIVIIVNNNHSPLPQPLLPPPWRWLFHSLFFTIFRTS